MERWVGKAAVVTGASGGIGSVLVQNLLKAGLKVVALDINIENQENTRALKNSNPNTFFPIQCNVTKEEDVLAAFAFVEKNFNAAHVLINCAAVFISEMTIEGHVENFRNTLDVNVVGVAICSKRASQLMIKHKVQGHIVNMNSILGHKGERFLVPMGMYSVSKFAITGLNETLRSEVEMADADIKITSISPGIVNTNLPMKTEIFEYFVQRSNILQPEDVVSAIMYTLSTPPHVQVNELIITPMKKLKAKDV